MKFSSTRLAGPAIIDLDWRKDERGAFARTFCERQFAAHGLDTRFVQQNVSESHLRGTLRGLHFQRGYLWETKLVRCTRGAIWDVLVDLRPESDTYLDWECFELRAEDHRAVYAPRGFAHGFITLCDDVEVTYLMSEFYSPSAQTGVRWNDPAFGIAWPMAPLVISDKDMSWPDYRVNRREALDEQP